MKIGRVISELFYPSGIKCVICGDELPTENKYGVCQSCELSYNTQYCERCGRAMKNKATFCDYCQNNSFAFDIARAPLVYEKQVVKLVHRLKYGGGRYLAENMARFMADIYFDEKLSADFITFVPMHAEKRKKRGYNQAELIARSLSEIIDLPVVNTLERVKQTGNLARMNKEERAKAIQGAYAPIVTKNDISDKSVILVDDVLTTGATANECATVLKKLKCKSVTLLTFASGRMRPDLY